MPIKRDTCCRNMQALTSAVKDVLAPVAASHENTFIQPSPEMRGTALGIKAAPLSQNIVVQLIRLTNELGLKCVHEVLCGIFADEMDSAPLYILQQALSSKTPSQPDPSTALPQDSVMCVLAHVQDLARAVKVCPVIELCPRNRSSPPHRNTPKTECRDPENLLQHQNTHIAILWRRVSLHADIFCIVRRMCTSNVRSGALRLARECMIRIPPSARRHPGSI